MKNNQVKMLRRNLKESITSKNGPSNNIKPKKGGGNGLLICIFISVIIMFFMAYMASIYDKRQEDYLAKFDVLGLPPTATHAEVKKRFRELSKL